MKDTPSDPIDLDLLRGFVYACRPGCALCCYTEPRVGVGDRAPLLRIAPAAEFRPSDGGNVIAARPRGGACQFLTHHRCGVHAARPHPCREFPVSVHVGERMQASLVLSCPGVDLAGLSAHGPRPDRSPPKGFDEELDSARARAAGTPPGELAVVTRRRRTLVRALERTGRWIDESEVRGGLRGRIPLPGREDYRSLDPPTADAGLEYLPLYFDGRAGPVAIGAGPGGWELLELQPEGGVRSHLGLIPPPETPPALDEAARALLQTYLEYHLERDAFLAGVAWDMAEEPEGDLAESARAELRSIGATVLSRAEVRAKATRDLRGPLTYDDVSNGIRATDMDVLDRPTWGFRL